MNHQSARLKPPLGILHEGFQEGGHIEDGWYLYGEGWKQTGGSEEEEGGGERRITLTRRAMALLLRHPKGGTKERFLARRKDRRGSAQSVGKGGSP